LPRSLRGFHKNVLIAARPAEDLYSIVVVWMVNKWLQRIIEIVEIHGLSDRGTQKSMLEKAALGVRGP